jgi:monovalent cation:H+ antiporter, CPA1 family
LFISDQVVATNSVRSFQHGSSRIRDGGNASGNSLSHSATTNVECDAQTISREGNSEVQMSLFQVASIVITLVAVFGYINHRFIKLPDAIGITAIGLVASLAIALLGRRFPQTSQWSEQTIQSIDFPETVFHGMLGFLLFAGSLHINLADIAKEKWVIGILATAGVLLSTFIVGTGMYIASGAMGLNLAFVYCLLFGALISPTDPIAVLAVLRKVGVPKSLETKIAGESLFNDGTGVVAFLTILGVASAGHAEPVGATALLLAREVLGGIVVGLGVGLVGFALLKGVDSYAIEIMITLSMATAGYALAEALHTSAPIAAVVMGLLVGNQGRRLAMSETTREHLFAFWELLDELLNLLLFGLIGIEIVALHISVHHFLVGLIAIPIVLIARLVSVTVPLLLLSALRPTGEKALAIMTWGGLRGGISVALALTLPQFEGRDIVITATYASVIFSILVQALTIGPLVRIWKARQRGGA